MSGVPVRSHAPLWYTGQKKTGEKTETGENTRKEQPMSAPPPEVFLEQWPHDLASDDRAPGTIRRYKSAITSFLAWYAEVEQRSLSVEHLSAIVLIGYRNFLQQTQGRSTSTVNGHVSALRAW